MKALEEKKIIICNATLMWKKPSDIPREKYILFSISGTKDEESVYVNAKDGESCGLTEIARLMADSISAAGKIPEIMFKPEIDSFTVYADGLFGRPLIPVEVWVLTPLKRRQKAELLRRLDQFGVSSVSLLSKRIYRGL